MVNTSGGVGSLPQGFLDGPKDHASLNQHTIKQHKETW